MQRKLLAAAAAAAVLTLAACGSSSPPAARQLAAKIPGCMVIDLETDVPATAPGSPVQDVMCVLASGAAVYIATFASARAEQRFIADGGFPLDPAPANPSCCIQANDWAATVSVDGSGNINFWPVIKALGGRAVHAGTRRGFT
jgi:hypothetical protein